MIISHKYKFIFFAVPKTATHAIRMALRKHLDDKDWEQVNLFYPRHLPFRELARKRHGHIKAAEIQPVLDKKMWQSYFKFALVRNPWDRYISLVAFYFRNNLRFRENPVYFYQKGIRLPWIKKNLLCQPQYTFITDSKGRVVVDYLGRYEKLQESYEFFCKQVGIPQEKLARLNASWHGPFEGYLDESLIKEIGHIYQKDIQLFGYQRPDATGNSPEGIQKVKDFIYS